MIPLWIFLTKKFPTGPRCHQLDSFQVIHIIEENEDNYTNKVSRVSRIERVEEFVQGLRWKDVH